MGRSKEREFLPAALEIQEAPPSPVGRAVLWTVVVVFATAVIWASLGRIDVVAVARGKLIPSDYSKVIQPLESGIVRAIHVRDGQEVRAGAVLIELDPTTSSAEHERLVKEHAAARVHIARLRALLGGGRTLPPLPGADPTFVALQQQMLHDQSSEQESRLEAARLLVEQRRAAVAATQADIARLEITVPMLTERAEAFKTLLAGGYVARMQYLEIEEQRVTRVQALAMQRERIKQDLAALAEAQKQLHALESEFKRSRLGELAEWETRAASLAQEVVKASQKSSIQRLTAPADGAVQQLAVHTVGGVVTPAQPLMVIVPRDHPLEVEAWVENKDVGFVSPGQLVEVKIDTFPFTRYGTIPGRITVVSRDAVQQEKGALVYAARATLDRASIQVDGRAVPLLAGMAVSAEIKTGERRLIEFFLSPVLRSARESLRER
ncbi:MAG TPA: HlyD family type I secretion periplasmic adaptor subunit [Methylomirabilota bacterium]|nr:HlyD family type I secretion periplasmic adaptor subunit [Methylomirabilota bacterium]